MIKKKSKKSIKLTKYKIKIQKKISKGGGFFSSNKNKNKTTNHNHNRNHNKNNKNDNHYVNPNKIIDLSKYKIQKHIPDELFEKIAYRLQHSTQIQKLILSNHEIDDNCIYPIIQALEHNKSLLSLDLSNNKISNYGAFAIAEMLLINTTLKKINLCKNNIDSEGEKALKNVLKTNKNVKIKLHSESSYFTSKSKFFGDVLKSLPLFL